MTTFDYAAVADTADELLKEFGQTVTLSRPSTGVPVYDPVTGTVAAGTPASYVGRGALLDYKQTDMNTTLVDAGDQRLYLSALAPMVEPTVNDSIIFAGRTYSVQRVGKISPAGTTVLYDLQLRGV